MILLDFVLQIFVYIFSIYLCIVYAPVPRMYALFFIDSSGRYPAGEEHPEDEYCINVSLVKKIQNK